MSGRSLTLKIMKRDLTAPAEPAKVYILVLRPDLAGVNNWYIFLSSSWVMGPAISSTSKYHLLVLEEDPQTMIKLLGIMHGDY